MSAKVSVIILNWNGEKLLRRFLPSVVRFLPENAELVVADNGSSDTSKEYIKKEYPQVKLVEFDRNYGFAEGYNKAIAQMTTPYCVLLNSDVEAKSDWVTPLLDFMENHPETGAAQPKILSVENPEKFEYAGACGGFLDKHGYPYCRGRIFDTVEVDNGQYDSPVSVFWASGAALMVRTEVYNRAGGLDKEFFAHMEEIDLCWRIRLLGYDIAVVPQSKVFHLGGGSLPAENPKKTYLNFRNNLLMLHKNSPGNVRRSRLFVRRLLDTVAWAKFIVTLDFKNASAIVGAHRDFAQMRKFYTGHPQKDILTASPNKPVSILWQYFIRGKKNFNRI
ncbi:MAG: glycosyltransferase family 2 protein [Paramuribaculum sp.]|nr:glycosyltransferase family 2 protein [Paramuribaculum sp.]